jgi:membrane protease YdiL (CAAX protease family)
MKWLTPILVYLAVGIGLFWVRHAFLALLGFHLAIVVSLLLARSQVPSKILLQSKNIRWRVLSVLLCGSSGVFLYFFWSSFRTVGDLSAHVQSLGLTRTIWPLFITYFVLVNPLVEEYFWRGYLGSPTQSLHVSDFLYSGFHGLILLDNMQAGAILYSLILLALGGWFWRQMGREDGGLLAPVLGHMAADFSLLMAVFLRT